MLLFKSPHSVFNQFFNFSVYFEMLVFSDYFTDLLTVSVMAITLNIDECAKQKGLERFIALQVIRQVEEVGLLQALKLNLYVSLQDCIFLCSVKL